MDSPWIIWSSLFIIGAGYSAPNDFTPTVQFSSPVFGATSSDVKKSPCVLCVPPSTICIRDPSLSGNQECLSDFKDAFILNVNDLADGGLPMARTIMRVTGLDPLMVPDISDHFWMEMLYRNHSATMNLSKGIVTKLATLERCGDITLAFKEENIIIHARLRFDNLEAKFNYELLSPLFSKEGTMTANMKNITASISVKYSLPNFQFFSPYVQITDIGEINADLKTASVIDWFGSLFVNRVVQILRNRIVEISEKTALLIMHRKIALVNDILKTNLDYAMTVYGTTKRVVPILYNIARKM